MQDIEEILKKISSKEVDIPDKVKYRIKYSLANKNQPPKHTLVKKLSTIVASILITSMSGIVVFAACGGTIAGKPLTEWMGIKFSDQYENYKMPIQNHEITHDETSINLISSICDDGFTVLQFNVKLSQKDRDYLKLDQNIISDEEINATSGYEKEFYEKSKNTKNSLHLVFNEENLTTSSNNNFNLIIDGENHWLRSRSTQTVEKLSDYEYNIYQLYFLTNSEINNKTDFTITLKDVALTNGAEISQENSMKLSNTGKNFRYIKTEGDYNINLSKEKNIENSKIITPSSNNTVTYKNINKTLEKVTITPLQTILKINTEIKNISLEDLQNTNNPNYIGISDYNIYSDNNSKLISHKYETSRKLIYENGLIEEWPIGEIVESKNFNNANLQLTEYVVVENNNTNFIKIVPILHQDEKEITLNSIDLNTN